MKELVISVMLVLAGYGLADAINFADLHELECIYGVETGRKRFQMAIERICPSNEWVVVEREPEEFDLVCVETAITETGWVIDFNP